MIFHAVSIAGNKLEFGVVSEAIQVTLDVLLQLLFLLRVHGSSYFLHPIGLEQPPDEVPLENPNLQGVSVREGGRCGVGELGTGEVPEWVDRHLVGIFGFLIRFSLVGSFRRKILLRWRCRQRGGACQSHVPCLTDLENNIQPILIKYYLTHS